MVPETVRALFRDLVRRRRRPTTDAERAIAVLDEADRLQSLLSTIEAFIRKERLTPLVERVRDHADTVIALAKQGALSKAVYEDYTTDINQLMASLEELTQAYQRRDSQPARPLNAYQKAKLAIGGLLLGAGLATGTAYAQEKPETPTTQTEKHDYVTELEERIKQIPIEEGKPWHFYNNKAVELAHAGQHDEAIRFSKKAIELAPDKDQPYTNIASAYCAKGESLPNGQEEARQYWVKALEYAQKGLAIFNAKKLTTLPKAQSAPLLCVKYQWLGNIYLRLGDSNEARRYLDLALASDNSPIARKLLAELSRPH